MCREEDQTEMNIASIKGSISNIASHLDQFETFVGAISTKISSAGSEIAGEFHGIELSIDRVADALEGILSFLKSNAKK